MPSAANAKPKFPTGVETIPVSSINVPPPDRSLLSRILWLEISFGLPLLVFLLMLVASYASGAWLWEEPNGKEIVPFVVVMLALCAFGLWWIVGRKTNGLSSWTDTEYCFVPQKPDWRGHHREILRIPWSCVRHVFLTGTSPCLALDNDMTIRLPEFTTEDRRQRAARHWGGFWRPRRDESWQRDEPVALYRVPEITLRNAPRWPKEFQRIDYTPTHLGEIALDRVRRVEYKNNVFVLAVDGKRHKLQLQNISESLNVWQDCLERWQRLSPPPAFRPNRIPTKLALVHSLLIPLALLGLVAYQFFVPFGQISQDPLPEEKRGSIAVEAQVLKARWCSTERDQCRPEGGRLRRARRAQVAYTHRGNEYQTWVWLPFAVRHVQEGDTLAVWLDPGPPHTAVVEGERDFRQKGRIAFGALALGFVVLFMLPGMVVMFGKKDPGSQQRINAFEWPPFAPSDG